MYFTIKDKEVASRQNCQKNFTFSSVVHMDNSDKHEVDRFFRVTNFVVRWKFPLSFSNPCKMILKWTGM